MGTLTLSAGLLLVFAILLAQQCAESAPRSDHGGKSDEHHGHGHKDHGHHGRHDDDDDDSDDEHHGHGNKDHGHHGRHDDNDDDDSDDEHHGHGHKDHGHHGRHDDDDSDDEHHGHGHKDHGHHGRHDGHDDDSDDDHHPDHSNEKHEGRHDDDDSDTDDDDHDDHSREKHKHEGRHDDDDDDDDGSSHGHHKEKDHDDHDHSKNSHEHHEHHKHKSHENHGHDGGDNWEELGNYQKRNLKIIWKFIQTQGEGFTGIIHFDGVDYQVDYILTYLSFNRHELSRTHVRTFFHILEEYVRSSRSSNDDDLLLDFIIKYIRRSSTAVPGTISFKGYKIPAQYISERLREDGLDVHDATRHYILPIIYDYINRNYPNTITVEVPAEPTEEDERTLKIILKFLRIEGRQDDVTFSFRRLPVPAQIIFQYVDNEGRAIESVTPEQLYHYIIKYFQDLQSASTGTNEEVPDSARQQLEEVLSFLQIQSGSGEAPTGYIEYNNIKIATSLIFTIIHTLGKSVYQIDINELYNIILIASEYVENNPAEDPEYITLIYILDILRNGSLQSDGYVQYGGYTISLRDIKNALNDRGVTPGNATPQMIVEIVTSLIKEASKPAPQPLGKEPTQEQQRQLSIIISFLQTQGDQYSGDIPFAGHVIPVDFILKELKQSNLDLNQANLYIIILKYVDESTESMEAPQEEVSTLKYILNFLKSESSSGEIPNGVITYDNTDIPVGLIYTIINTSGKTIQDADINDMYSALQLAIQYVNDNPEEDPTYVTLIYILNSLKNGDTEPNGYVVYNRFIIPLKNIEDALQQKGISPENATPDIILSILNSQISDETTPAPEQLGQEPSENQKKQLLAIISLLQAQGLDYSGDIVFSGLSIPISYIIQQLTQQNVDLNNLEENTVYYIIKNYVDITTADEPPEEMIPQLKNLLNFLQLQDDTGDIPTGSIAYNNIQIPLSLIYTIIEISGKSVKKVDINTLYKAILTAFKYVNQNPDSNPTTVNLIYIVDTLKNGKSNPKGYVVYNRRIITVKKIQDELKLQGLEPEQVTPELLFNIITSNIQMQTTASPQPLPDEPTVPQTQELQVLVNFLQSQGQNYTGDLPFSGYNVPIRFIFNALQQKNIEVSDIDDKTLYLIIVQYVDSIHQTTTSTTESVPDDEKEQIQTITNFLILESRSPQSPTGYITYENTTIPTSIVLTILDATNIPIDEADVNDVYLALQTAKSYVNNNPDENPTDITVKYILDLLKNINQTEGYVFYNGKNITLETIKDALNEQGVTPEDATPEIILNIINSQASSEPTTTITPEALGSEPTEHQGKELSYIIQFLKDGSIDYQGTIPFAGYLIQLEDVKKQLAEQSKRISNLDTNTLYNIILAIVRGNEATTPTTESSAGPILTPDEESTLQNTVELLQAEGDNATGNITIHREVIPISYLVAVIRIHQIDFQDVTAQQLYQFILEYIEKEQNPPPVNETSGVPADDVLTVQLMLHQLKQNSSSVTIVFDGKEIPKDFILKILNITGKDVQQLTISELYKIFVVYLQSEGKTKTEQLPQEYVSTLQQLLNGFKSMGSKLQGSITIGSQSVSLQKLWQIIALQKIDVQNMTIEELYGILVILLDEQGTKVDPQQIIYNKVITALRSDYSSTYMFSVGGKVIPLSHIITSFGLQKDSSGHYDTSKITVSGLWQVIMDYVNSNQVTTATTKAESVQELTFTTFKEGVAKYNEGYTVKINYNGKEIPIEYVFEQLNLQKDSNGHYNDNGVTRDQLIQVLDTYRS